MFRTNVRWQSSGFILLAFSGAAFGQVDRATLGGTVFDPSNAPLPAATVSVSFEATGLKRSVETSGSGTYVLPGLPLGKCRVTIQAKGFQTQQADVVSLEVGETRTLNFQLSLQVTSESVEVSASTVDLEQSSAETGGVIGLQQVQDLPINERNWAGLMLLVPGAINTGIGNQTGIRFAGHGLDDNKLVFDGTDATGILRQSQKTDLRLQISSESIAEFRVNDARLFVPPSLLATRVEWTGLVDGDYLNLPKRATWRRNGNFVTESQWINGWRAFGAEQVAPQKRTGSESVSGGFYRLYIRKAGV